MCWFASTLTTHVIVSKKGIDLLCCHQYVAILGQSGSWSAFILKLSAIIVVFDPYAAPAAGAHVRLQVVHLALVLMLVLVAVVHELEEVVVLVLDVGELVGHLALQQQVAQVALFQEPPVELSKGALA